MTAFHRGVRIHRSASVENNVRMQGNADMLSLSALAVRENIKQDERVKAAMTQWWSDIKMKNTDGTIGKEAFIVMTCALHRVLELISVSTARSAVQNAVCLLECYGR